MRLLPKRKKVSAVPTETTRGLKLIENCTLEELREALRLKNPACGRGGCSHEKEFHILNEKGKLECHQCPCREFID